MIVTHAVFNEVIVKDDSAARILITCPSWLTIEQAPQLPSQYYRLISAKLHAEELEVISLALSSGADSVVLDDNAARKTAKYFGLSVTGTLGLLLKAKSLGIVHEVAPLVNKLRENGFRVSDTVVSDVLQLAHEK